MKQTKKRKREDKQNISTKKRETMNEVPLSTQKERDAEDMVDIWLFKRSNHPNLAFFKRFARNKLFGRLTIF